VGRAAALIAAGVAAALCLQAAAAERFTKGTLWRVTRPGTVPSHVFGTIHLADPRVLEIPAPVARALEHSRSLAMESPPSGPQDWRMAEAAELPAGQTLEPLIGAPAYGRLRAELARRNIPDAIVAHLKPWAALANITVTPEGYESATLDMKLFELARARKLRIEALESNDEQVAAFDSIPAETQIAMLRHTLEQRDYLASMIEPTLQAWLKRDLAGIRAVNGRIAARFPEMAPHYALFIRHLVENRSISMAHRLYTRLRRGGVFVAVGATHLPGDKGLLRLIEEQGYRVQRVY